MTMYELVDPTAESILASDAGRGVTVRVILDQNRERSANTPAYDYLAAHGVHVVWAPSSFEATHEKAVVVDAGQADAEALIMTLNLTSRYYPTTRDFAVADTGRADVQAIEAVFAADFADRTVAAPPGADLLWSPGSEPALVSLIDSAHVSLSVENEEMGSPAIVGALVGAAGRGVRVDVTMTSDSEWDQEFAALTKAGAHVHLFPDNSTALYIHAKAIVADGHAAFVGSENFSDASLDDNRELGILTANPAIVTPLAAVLAADFAAATASPATASPATASPGSGAPAPAPTPVPVAAPASSSCHPLTDAGHCYKAGEYCRDDDHGASGTAGDGKGIVCRPVGDGWEWELG